MDSSQHTPQFTLQAADRKKNSMASIAQRFRGSVRTHMKRVTDDITNRRMMPLKLLWFMEMAGIVAVWPYNTIHMAQLGMDQTDQSNIQVATRITGALAPLTTGFIGDQLGNFKVYLGLIMAIEALSGAAVILIPSAVQNTSATTSIVATPQCLSSPAISYDQVAAALNCSQPFSKTLSSLALSDRCRVGCDNSQTSLLLRTLVCQPERCSVVTTLSPNRTVTGNMTALTRLLSLDGWVWCAGVADASNATCDLRCTAATTPCVSRPAPPSAVSHSTTLWLYIALRAVYGFGMASSYTLLDATTFSYCSEFGVDYGLQRLWGTLAAMLVSPLLGYLVDHYSPPQSPDFSYVFYALLISRGICLLLLACVNISFRKKPSRTLLKDTWRLLRKPELLILLPVPIIVGMATGHLESHMYVYLQRLGFSSALIGGTVSVGSVTELLFLAVFGAALGLHVARSTLLMVGLLVMAVRYIGFQLVTEAWMVLLLEAMDGAKGGLLVPALMMSCIDMVPPEMIATARGLMGTVLFGIAPIVGTQMSGYLIVALGYRWSFGVFGALLLAGAAVYVLAGVGYRKLHHRCYQLTEETPHVQPHNGLDNPAAQISS